MEDPNLSQSHLLTNEVDIDLNMFRAMVMDRIGCHVNCTNIVTIDNGSRGDRKYEVPEARPQHGQLPYTQPRHWSERQLFVF